jgi:hypothetical protein
MPKGHGKRFEAPKAVDTACRRSTLPHDFQGRKELKTTLMMGLKVGAKAKTLRTIVTHVEADLEEHTIAPYLARQMSGDFVSQEHGVPHDGPKDLNTWGCTREI